MQRDHSEERITSANSSPRHSQKMGSGLMGLLTKRSTKIQPQPHSADDLHESPLNDGTFAKTHTNNHSPVSLPRNGISKPKSPTLPASSSPSDVNVAQESSALDKSHSSGFINFHRKSKTAKLKHSVSRYNATDGSQSDSGASCDVILRKHSRSKPKSPNHNHNRFSHQFSLCCKADKRSATPVTVHYSGQGPSRNENMSLSWSSTDNTSLSLSSSIMNPNYVCLQTPSGKLTECASAPQSPVSRKSLMFSYSEKMQTSPSSNSLKNMTGAELSPTDYSGNQGDVAGGGPAIRPLAVSESRSRLRLKLFPPGKEIPPSAIESSVQLVITPQQHMSSPNIVGEVETPFFPKEEINHAAPSQFRFFSNDNILMQRQGSSSGLARQALMAAQMLSLIPTDKARERSLLDGRLGSSSLLGPSELSKVLPNKEVHIFVGTWNMNGQNPPKQMNDFVLPINVEHVPDIVAMGTQESSPDRFEWEVTIQETLGPSHVLFHSTTLGTLHLAIYMRRDLIWYCSAPEDASMSVRTGSAFRTKGAVAISFCLFGTSMLFVTSHLTAHQQKVKERVSDVKRIIHALDLPRNLNLRHKNKDVTQNFDNVFWCGDLNFRLGEPREKLLEWIQNTKFPLPSHLPNGYMHTDQLSTVLADGAAFRGFMEANITFPPTYKYDPGTQHFDTSSKQRAPAYTDRILYKFRQTQGLTIRRQSIIPGMMPPDANHPNVECLLYDSVPSITTSDHKPVWALFKTSIRAGTDSIPLAAGLFCRDIYLEGMKRRLNNHYSGSSAVCSIQ